MTFNQFLMILWARRKLAIFTLATTVLATLVVSLFLPKEFTATTSVLLDVKSPDPIVGVILPGLVAPGYMATQMDIIQSERVATRVVKKLGIDRNAAAIGRWKEEGQGEGTVEGFYAERLKKQLDIKPSRESNVINISFSAVDPAFAAAVANAFARAYIDTTIDLRVEPARQYTTWFEERQKGLRDNLEQAQSRLSAYQQEKGIVVTDDRLDAETARLNELVGQLAAAQGQRADAVSRQKTGSSQFSQDVLQNPLIQNIKADLARAEAKLSEISRNVGQNHPQYQQQEAQIEGFKQQLNEEIARISGGAAVANELGARKEHELKAAIEQQKKRLLELKSERDQLAVLLKDVENAQRAYEAVAQRTNLTNLESQSQQTNVLVLSPAEKPTRPARPRLRFNLLLSVFFGTLLAVAAAFAAEYIDRRIRSGDDLSDFAGAICLGSMNRSTASKKSFFNRLLNRFVSGAA